MDERDSRLLNAATERFETRLSAEHAALRREMADLRGELKAEIANSRADLLKWSFLFWIGQVAVVLGLARLLP